MKHFGLIFLIFLISCQTTKVYYNDTSGVDDGEIFGNVLHYFFSQEDIKSNRIKVFSIRSNKLSAQLNKIKKQIIEKDSTIIYSENGIFIFGDDNIYDCAFITQKHDTIYGTGLLRYKNLLNEFKTPDVTKIFHVKNQELNNQLKTIKELLIDSGYIEKDLKHFENIFIMQDNDTISVSSFYFWKYKDKIGMIFPPNNLVYYILKNETLYNIIGKDKQIIVKKVRQNKKFKFYKNEIKRR